VSKLVQALDTIFIGGGVSGLLNISSTGVIGLPNSFQVIPVHPTVLSVGGAAPLYQENTLNAIAAGVSVLQGFAHYEGYAAVLHTVPYADLFQALPTTLIEPVEPVRSLIQSGVYGTGALPPFVPIIPGAPGSTPTPNITVPGSSPGLPASGGPLPFAPNPSLFKAPVKPPKQAAVLYTGVIVSLTGNTMDLVRGQMDDGLDVSVTFNQKDATEQYRFRAAQRHALRVKDSTAIILLVFLDC
jgi:hypothetical protein